MIARTAALPAASTSHVIQFAVSPVLGLVAVDVRVAAAEFVEVLEVLVDDLLVVEEFVADLTVKFVLTVPSLK